MSRRALVAGLVIALFAPADFVRHEVPRDRQVVFSCHSGGRSENVCRYLEANEDGFGDVVNLEGGIVAWSQAGLPTT